MAANAVSASTQAPSNGYRWMQLIIGIVCMAMIANLQYGWTYFVGPMAKANSWTIAQHPGRIQHIRRAGNLADAD